MFNFKAKFFPKITSTPTKLWDLYQISRATGKDLLTIKRYMQWAEVKAGIAIMAVIPFPAWFIFNNLNPIGCAHFLADTATITFFIEGKL